MGHSRAEKAQSRERILVAAARDIRKDGLDAIAIADLMQSAGLTHGAFYSHFPSRAALIEAAVAHALAEGEARFGTGGQRDAEATARRYLSRAHRDHPEAGCAVAALAADAGRDETARPMLAERLDHYVARMAGTLGGDEDATRRALAIWSMMVGALTLSRLADGEQGDRILAAARAAISAIVDTGDGPKPAAAG